ncbi:GIN domain-containing protein [Parasphingopyxis marina]|uniref:DUF2807 domain-containing protein n=1 Tax=Parasphingopyxis marina TaxID=2761622 RepID=A0A842HV90_9SPHN|nr:DUF2807 domain-containing protein [Parasphingopyxis marina]MBC2776825.1 DUF2807 domain-containing protein [Parasphingopyxis marina]
MIARLAFAAALIALAFPAQAERRGYSVTNFDRLQVNGPFVVRLTTGGGASAYVEGDNRAINEIALDVTGRTLRIRRNISSNWGGYPGERNDAAAIIYLSTPRLEQATVVGAGDLEIDRMQGQRLLVSLGGNGRIAVGVITAEDLGLALTGAGIMEVGGEAGNGTVNIQGPGTLVAPGLSVGDLTVTLNGPGSVEIAAEREADITSIGNGTVTVHGDASCIDRSVGSGNVSCAGFLNRR